MSAPLIAFRGVDLAFGDHLVLGGLSFEIGRGEICHLRHTVALAEVQTPAASIAENPVRLLHREIEAQIAPASDLAAARLAQEERAKLQALLAALVRP